MNPAEAAESSADTCVARVPVFASLSPHDQRRVEALARPTHLHAGETAFSADDDMSQLMVVHTGRLKVFRLLADGTEQLVRVLVPGEFTGETSVFTGQRPDVAWNSTNDEFGISFSAEDGAGTTNFTALSVVASTDVNVSAPRRETSRRTPG